MKKFLSMLVALLVLVGIWYIYGKVSVVETRVTAVAGEYEESFSTNAVIIRNEYPVISELSGTLQSSAQKGQRVTKYTNVGFVYAGDVSGTVLSELEEVTKRIEEINNMQDSAAMGLTDIDEINARITAFAEKIAEDVYSGNNALYKENVNEINMLISRKRFLEGESQGENSDITQLMSKKANLENQLSGKRMNLFAPGSGLYFDFVDGYEGLSIDDVQTLTESTVKKILKGEDVGASVKSSVCKIVDNSSWVISAVVSKDEVENLAPGSRVHVRFTGKTEKPVEATVHSIVADGKKFVLNISGTRYADGIYNERVCSVDIIKNEYSGLKIPADAVKNAGEKGDVVEVRTSGGIKEKTVKVLYYADDGTVIVKEGSQNGELLLYDDVVVRSKRQ